MATPLVTLYQGSPLMVDYTPVSAVTGGDVVVLGELPCILHNDIAANVKGAIAIGGGVYKVPKSTGSGSAIAIGANVWWNASSEVVATTASTHKHFGETVLAASDDDTYVYVHHNPRPALS